MKESNADNPLRRKVLRAIGGTGVAATITSLSSAQKNIRGSDKFVIEYTDLSTEAKAVFETALASGEIERVGATIPRDLLMHTHVLYQAQLYALNVSVSYEDEYKLESERTTREEIRMEIEQQIGAADSSEELFRQKGRIRIDNLGPRASRLVEKSLVDGGVTLDTAPPESLLRNQFLSRGSELYRIRLAVGDRPTVTIAPKTVE